MNKGSPPMGMHKHGVSGKAPKSPRYRHALKREAEADVRKRTGHTKWFPSITEAIKG